MAVLDTEDAHYFEERRVTNQHSGGALFAYDKTVTGWLFGGH